MDLITYIPGVANSGLFTPGPNTPSPWNVPIVGAVDGNSPASATRNMAEIYNRLLFADAALVEAAGLPIDHADWAQLVHAFRSNGLIYATGAGTANAQTVSYTPAIKALVDGMVLWFKAGATNTGAVTLDVSGLGAKAVVGGAHAALQGGEIIANGKCLVVWNAALNSFVLVECTGAALQVAVGTQSSHAATLSQLGLRGITAITALGAGNFTVPAGVYVLWVQIWGGAGGGGGSGSGGGTSGGGGGGGSAWKRLVVTPGQVIPYFVGSAGITTGAGGAGTAGTATTFNGTVTAGAGAGGQANPSGNGGTGGVASGGDVNMNGSPGGTGAASNVQGGMGGAAPGGGGGGSGAQGTGGPGAFPGGGGGGGGSGQAGGNGAAGQIVITY